MPLPRRAITAFLIAPATAACFSAVAAPGAEVFFRDPAMRGAHLSPSGRYIGLRLTADSGRVMLGTLDTTNMTIAPVGRFTNADIARFGWLSDQRLAFTAENVADDGILNTPGVYAIDRDGSAAVTVAPLVKQQGSFGDQPSLEDADSITGATRAGFGPDDMKVQVWSDGQRALARLNTRNGEVTSLLGPFDRSRSTYLRTGTSSALEGKDRNLSWLLDQAGDLRIVVVRKAGRNVVYHASADKKWAVIADYDPAAEYGIRPNLYWQGKLYVSARPNGGYAGIYRFDLEKKALHTEPLISVEGHDAEGEFVLGNEKILGYRVFGETRSTVWFDASYQALQMEVDRLLPATVNFISRRDAGDTANVLVWAESDQSPRAYYLYHQPTKKLHLLGESYPGIAPNDVAQRTQRRFTARDGLQVPVYLTLPRGERKGPLPMVVLSGTTSWIRHGDWEWEPEVQFLATRGYAVLQVDARGTEGYGDRHYRAGVKQWGAAMQDDLADGVRWAVAQGIADPARVCIGGAGYGGYAALTGLARDATLYRCGFTWSALVDTGLMEKNRWKDFATPPNSIPMQGMVDAKAYSPLAHAAEIKQPLLMGYGMADTRVPYAHGEAMMKALKAAGAQLEWVAYPDTDHAWPLASDRIDYWRRVEKFLARHLGNDAPPATKP